MSDANYKMLVEIGGIMDGAVPREGICTTADGVRWLCDRVKELKNELYETKRERDEARKQNTKLLDKLDQLYRDVEIDKLKEGAK
jgi:hypothetical protein